MQSLTEELETSREELQSSNEEVMILNQELLDKQDQFNEARNFGEAIVATIREPLVILDKKFFVRSANFSFYQKFNLTEKEVEGTFFFHLQNHRWDNSRLRHLLNEILPNKKVMENFEFNITLANESRYMLLNARQIVSEKDSAQMILLAIEDFELLIEQKKASIESSELPIIEGFKVQIDQLFYNIIGNALKFTKDNRAPVISISYGILSAEELEEHPSLNKEKVYYDIVFQDNGIGFNQKKKRRFSPCSNA